MLRNRWVCSSLLRRRRNDAPVLLLLILSILLACATPAWAYAPLMPLRHSRAPAAAADTTRRTTTSHHYTQQSPPSSRSMARVPSCVQMRRASDRTVMQLFPIHTFQENNKIYAAVVALAQVLFQNSGRVPFAPALGVNVVLFTILRRKLLTALTPAGLGTA